MGTQSAAHPASALDQQRQPPPPRVRRPALRCIQDLLFSDPREIVVHLGDGTIAEAGRPGVPSYSVQDAAAWRALATSGAAATLIVPVGQALLVSLTVPVAALDRLDEMLALDLERATPFKREDVLNAARLEQRDATTAQLNHMIVKRSTVTPALAAAQRAGLPVKAIRLSDPRYSDVNLLPPAQRQRSRTLRGVTVAVRLSALAAVVSLTASAGALIWSLSRDITSSTEQHAALTQTLTTLRREMAEEDKALRDARFAREARGRRLRTVEILEDVTRRLPAAAWVTELRLDERSITLTGYAANASELIPLLSRMATVATAEFVAPVTRDPQKNAEQFQIRLNRVAAPTEAP